MNPILGMRSTADYAANVVTWDYADAVLQYDRYGELPLTALMSRAKTVAINSTERKWRDKDYDARQLVVNGVLGASTSGAVQTLVVVGGAFYAIATMILFLPGAHNGAGEYLRVTADPTTPTSILVARGWGQTFGTAVGALGVGLDVTLVGTAAEEGSTLPTPVNTNPFDLFNLTQIFRTPYTITGTDKVVLHQTGDPWKAASVEGTLIHMKDIENAMFFGRRSKSIGGGGKELRTMGGLVEYIQTNRADYNGAATLADLEDFTTEVAKFGNRDINAICGDTFVTRVNRLVKNETNYMTQSPMKVFGYDVVSVVMPNGVTLRMFTAPLLNGNPYYRNSGWLLNMDDIERHPLNGRDTHTEPDIIAPGTDAQGEALLTEMTMSVRREKNMGLITNL